MTPDTMRTPYLGPPRSEYVRETPWGWIVEGHQHNPTWVVELAGPFSCQEAADAWLDGWTEGRMAGMTDTVLRLTPEEA